MYRFLLRPRWIAFHLLVLAAIVAMVNLGFWQLRRLDERQEFNATVIERTEQPPRPLGDVLADPGFDPDEAEWLPITASGTYLSDQIVEFNQSQGGRAGENVLTALVLDDGTTVLVNRGFIALGSDVPDAPAVKVDVVGLIRTSEVRGRGGLTDSSDGPLTEVRRVDIPAIAPQLPGSVAPVYVQLVASDPDVVAGDPAPATRPELGNGPHLSYAVQWFIFSVCVAIGWILAVHRSIGGRRRARRTTDAGEPDSLSGGTAEPATAGSR
jgi:cytochrome oxidase assembly protein ShyY1